MRGLMICVLLLTLTWPAAAALPNAAPITRLFAATADHFPGHLGLAFLDLTSGARADLHGRDIFESASLIKLPIMVTIFAQVNEGKLKLSDKIVLQAADKSNSGWMKDVYPGTALPVEMLLEAMITQSDNTATDMLARHLGRNTVNREMKLLGLRNTSLMRKMMDFDAIGRGSDNITTPLDMARLLEVLAHHLMPQSDRMLAILERQHIRNRIPALLPKGTVVANKTGEMDDVVHDVGIVYSPAGPYLLCMLGDQVTNKPAVFERFRKLSLAVYRALNAKK